jgi:uncharacterized protein YbaA (DUF1428 family)
MYVDGFVAAVPTEGKEAYRRHAREAAALFKARGALSVVEAWGDDVPEGEVTSFGMAVKRREDETVVFSWVAWPDKATRDAAWASMEEVDMGEMPFDMTRMIYGGFEPLLEA